MKILLSACLGGVNCRYDGQSNQLNFVSKFPEHEFILICPEVMGGLMTPRTPAERNKEKIISETGEDVTSQFEVGARSALATAQRQACDFAILKERSPSCGSTQIYDGSFTHTVIAGEGVCAHYLREAGFYVYNETEGLNYLEEIQCLEK